MLVFNQLRLVALAGARAAKSVTPTLATRSLATLAFGIATIGALSGCDLQALQSHAAGVAHHAIPLDNFGEILNPKKK